MQLMTAAQAASVIGLCHGFISSERPFQVRTHSTLLQVSELHIPGYRESKKQFVLADDDLIVNDNGYGDGTPVLTKLEEWTYSDTDYSSLIPFQNGHLLHKTSRPIFSPEECQRMIDEAEFMASEMGWTTKRHGNYPTTDIPIAELPSTLRLLRKTLEERIYPLLRKQFEPYLPDGTKLRVADGFIVKYDAEGGQSELRPHRDGSVVSFNIALNKASEFDGGGTWFESLGDSIRIDQGEIVSHASGIMHGGHGITRGKRYIMVCFVILEGYDSWSMRFYNNVRDL